ncbi:transglycosylase SLT domain-containing protein [Streptomyces sp. INA 01156]
MKDTVGYLKDNPGLTDMILEAAKWAAILGGGAIVLGSVIKMFGAILKLGSPLAGLAKGAVRGARGTARIAGQATGIGTQTNAQKESKSIRKAAQQQAKAERKEAQREARRARREARRESDPRNRTAGRLHADWLERQGQRQAENTRTSGRQDARDTRRQGREDTTFGDRYQQRRTNLHGGDNRNLATRAWDSVRGKNSQTEEIKVSTEAAQRAIQQLETKIEGLRNKLQSLKGENFKEVSRSLADGDSSVRAAAERAEKAIRKADIAAENLKGLKFGSLRDEFSRVAKNSDNLEDEVKETRSSVSSLNSSGLGKLDGEFNDASSKAKSLDSSIVAAAKQAGNLNKKTLGSVKGQVDNVKKAADDASKKFGAGETSLISRVGKLNSLKTNKIVNEIEDLRKKLENTTEQAKKLNTQLNNISSNAPGGKAKGPSKTTKKAMGGVLPGYTPGRDVHMFTSPTAGALALSGGEAVMRPEWTAAMGANEVNRLNYIARTQGVSGVRQEMKFAKGGIIEQFGLDILIDHAKNYSLGHNVRGATQTMTMNSTSRPLGGPVQKGILGSGTDSANYVGFDLGNRFRFMYDFLSRDIWEFLKKAPTGGLGTLIGAVGGAIGPVAGGYFWDDVWKGSGNILERGQNFLGHMFSTDTMGKIVSDFFSGGMDSVQGIYDSAKALVTDPVGTVSGAIEGVWEMVRTQYGGIIDMVKSLRTIWTSPKDYAEEVIGDIYDTAKEALPNLEGLFDFSGDGLSSKAPDIACLVENHLSMPAPGDAVTRWTPQVKMALAQLGLPASDLDLVLHRIRVESGGNPNAINLWDSNAKAGYPSQGLMQTIPQTFAAYACRTSLGASPTRWPASMRASTMP